MSKITELKVHSYKYHEIALKYEVYKEGGRMAQKLCFLLCTQHPWVRFLAPDTYFILVLSVIVSREKPIMQVCLELIYYEFSYPCAFWSF